MQIEVTDHNVCPISLIDYDTLRLSDSLVCTPCRHLFRDMDLMQWLTIKESCPVCRAVVRLDDLNYGDTPKPTLLMKITGIFLSLFCGVKEFFEDIGKAVKDVFVSRPETLTYEPEAEINPPS